MPRKQGLKLKGQEISFAAYSELKAFCLQYNEKRKRLKDLYGFTSERDPGMPKGNMCADPTAHRAEVAAKLSTDVELIEKTAQEVDASIANYLLKNVTEEWTWDAMKLHYNIPIGRRQFYAARKNFFFLLALRKGMIE